MGHALAALRRITRRHHPDATVEDPFVKLYRAAGLTPPTRTCAHTHTFNLVNDYTDRPISGITARCVLTDGHVSPDSHLVIADGRTFLV